MVYNAPPSKQVCCKKDINVALKLARLITLTQYRISSWASVRLHLISWIFDVVCLALDSSWTEAGKYFSWGIYLVTLYNDTLTEALHAVVGFICRQYGAFLFLFFCRTSASSVGPKDASTCDYWRENFFLSITIVAVLGGCTGNISEWVTCL